MTYERGTLGHVLQSLRDLGINEHIASSVIFEPDKTLSLSGRTYARWSYFDGIEKPLFRFADNHHLRHEFIRDESNKLKARFRLSLSVHDSAAFEIYGIDATEKLHELVRYQMLTNLTTAKGYELSQAAGAFFQGGSHDPKGEWIYIEFWKPQGAQAWIDHLNEIYEP